MSGHTPGPWVMHIGTGKVCDTAQTTHIATMAPTCATGTWEANARLIAAAPELLEALEGLSGNGEEPCFSHCGDYATEAGDYHSLECLAARVAVAKATGGS